MAAKERKERKEGPETFGFLGSLPCYPSTSLISAKISLTTDFTDLHRWETEMKTFNRSRTERTEREGEMPMDFPSPTNGSRVWDVRCANCRAECRLPNSGKGERDFILCGLLVRHSSERRWMREKIPVWFGLCFLPDSESRLETVRLRAPSVRICVICG